MINTVAPPMARGNFGAALNALRSMDEALLRGPGANGAPDAMVFGSGLEMRLDTWLDASDQCSVSAPLLDRESVRVTDNPSPAATSKLSGVTTMFWAPDVRTDRIVKVTKNGRNLFIGSPEASMVVDFRRYTCPRKLSMRSASSWMYVGLFGSSVLVGTRTSTTIWAWSY